MGTPSDNRIRELRSRYQRLEMIVDERLKKALSYDKQPMIHITHRIKTTESIRGKLERRAAQFPDIDSLYDFLGFRVICYFQEDIDRIGELIAGSFRVDWDKSKDQRKLIDPTSFGYLSLHYICALPEDEGYPEDLTNLWFEVQIRTILQHTWAEIEHDLGYKTEFGIPRAVRRNFSRAASLLETADQIFTDIRKNVEEYKIQVRENIRNDCADDMFLDQVTLAEFTSESKVYRSLLADIAAITGAHITEADPESQLEQLSFLGMNTLGDLVAMIGDHRELALQLARERLTDLGLEELTSTVAYYYLFAAKLICSKASPERIREFFALTSADEKSIERNTNWILSERKALRSE